MKIRHIALAAIALSTVAVSHAIGSAAQAAVLGSGTTCANATFSYVDCAGAFDGNDKGANGTGLDNLNNLFGGGWSFAGDNEDGLVSFTTGGLGEKAGKASTDLSGFGAIAVKAGNSYSLYTVDDLSNFDWLTTGVNTVGQKNRTPGLSHISVYRQDSLIDPPAKQEVPEPSMLLGIIGLVGLGMQSRRK